jgi:hypothetical protein
VSRPYILGIDLGTTIGCARVYVDGSCEAASHKSQPTISARCVAVAGLLERNAGPLCLGVVIEEPFGPNPMALKTLYSMMGAAVLACENLKLPYSIIHLMKLKVHATGSGKAKKPEMQAAAKARWGIDLSEDAADAAWAGAYGLDNNLFA